jgi:GST-like protein
METKRQLDVLDRRLAEVPFVGGQDYSIADMAIWPWYGGLVLGRAYNAAEFLDVNIYKNVMAWAEKIDARPAVKRGRMVNKSWGDEAEKLPERHSAADFASKV